MSEKPSSTRNLRLLSISIPPSTTTAAGPEKNNGESENVTKGETVAKPENSRPEESLEEKTIKQKLLAALPGVSSTVTTPGAAVTPNPLSGANSSVVSMVVSMDMGNVLGPNVINKQLLSKLNKSLKEKQKVIQTKEGHPKNPTLIQEMLTTLPLQAAFSHNSPMPSQAQLNDPAKSASPGVDNTPDDQDPEVATREPEPKPKAKKRIAKQNSTRTDFFAAKLASAVDDVSSSNSDETFVYENNVNDFEEDATHASAPTSGLPGSATVGDDTGLMSHNIDFSHLINDTFSVPGSVRNGTPMDSTINSPLAEVRKELHDEPSKPEPSRAESIHSFQSTKVNPRNTFNITPPNTTNGRLLQPPNLTHVENPAQYLNPYFHNLIRDASNKSARRKNSSHSLISDDKSYLLRSPMLNFSDPNHTLVPLLNAFPMHLPNTPSIAEGYDERTHSLDGEDDESLSGDDGASSLRLVSTDSKHNTTITGANEVQKIDHLSLNGKLEKKSKVSKTSSKLRSTTSKLFDKKGAQPRRYSTIPDDIDIEDFDDELIYYDNNNIRFPYNSQNGNETSSLLGGAHRLPHHRSLNLNFNNKRQPSYGKAKRYSSLGYVPPNGKNNDIFPFPYPEVNQKYYYDFDEYDEDAQAEGDEMQTKGMAMGKAHLSPNNAHFFLPRKVSHNTFGNSRVRFIKSFVYTLISIICILAVGFILGFLLASTKDLANISIVSIENALVTKDELVFSIIVEALNPGWFTVEIEEVEIDIFAKSGYLGQAGTTIETVLLGSVLNFESPLVFDGSFFNKALSRETGEIKLIGPGKNLTGANDPMQLLMGYKIDITGELEPHPPDNSEKWAIISKHPFDLILRGVLKYSLPMTKNTRSAVVNKVGYVDPSVPGLIST